MAKDRLEPCKNYEYEGGECKKGRTAEHRGYCQKCKLYEPRARVGHVNRKKEKLDKIRREEV